MIEFYLSIIAAFAAGIFLGAWLNHRAGRGLSPIPLPKIKKNEEPEEPIREYGDWKL